MKNPFTIEQWIGWMVATATAAVTMSSYAFNKFDTIEHATEQRTQLRDEIMGRLDRIENKLDRIIESERRH